MNRLTLATLLSLAVTASAAAEDSVGTKIGKGIRDAVDVAAPPIGKLINLIWPKDNANVDKDKASKAEVVAAAAKVPAVKNAADSLGAVRDQAETLNIVVGMLRPVTEAQLHLATIQALLSAPAVDWQLVRNEIGDLETALKPVSDLPATTILKLKDNALRAAVDDIVAATKQTQTDLKRAAAANPANLPGATAAAKDYAKALAGLVKFTGYVFFDLNTEIQAAASTLKGGAAGPPPRPNNPFKADLEKAYPRKP